MKLILAALIAALPFAAVAQTTVTVTDPTDNSKTVISAPAGFPVLLASGPPSGPSLFNTFGTWSWGPATSGGDYKLLLNGTWTGTGLSMLVKAGSLYVNTATTGWYVYSSAGFDASPAP